MTEYFYYLQNSQPAGSAFSNWGLSGSGSRLSISRKMRLPLPAVAPPAALTISNPKMPAADTSITFTVSLGKFTCQALECCKNLYFPKVMRQTLLLCLMVGQTQVTVEKDGLTRLTLENMQEIRSSSKWWILDCFFSCVPQRLKKHTHFTVGGAERRWWERWTRSYDIVQ